MLGVWSSPTSLDKNHLQEVVLGKTSNWVGGLKNAHLPTHLAWKAYQFRLCPSTRYGIATLATPRKNIEGIIHKLEFEMLSYLEVNQQVKTEWRRLLREFGNLAIKQFISWMEVLLQHYSAGFTTSRKLQALLEAMQLEIGYSGNSFNEDYAKVGILATERWVKAVWEGAAHYSYNITLDYPTESLPLNGNRNLATIF